MNDLIILCALVVVFGKLLYSEWRLWRLINDTARICGDENKLIKKRVNELEISNAMRSHKFRFKTGQAVKEWEVIHRYTKRVDRRDVFERARFRVDFDAFYLVAPINRPRDNSDFETHEVNEDVLTQYSKEDVFLV